MGWISGISESGIVVIMGAIAIVGAIHPRAGFAAIFASMLIYSILRGL